MPVYRKGRREVKAEEGLFQERPLSRKEKVPRRKWHCESSSLYKVSRDLGFDILGFLKHRAEERPSLKVLDWGCGAGAAAEDLALVARHGKLNAKIYGYSGESWKEWNEISGVTFLHSPARASPSYFPGRGLDLVYSRHGLFHLQGEPFRKLISAFAGKLAPGGKMVFDIVRSSQKAAVEETVSSLNSREGNGKFSIRIEGTFAAGAVVKISREK